MTYNFGTTLTIKFFVMGKLSDSLLSGSNGRTGRLVVANVLGIEVIRMRPRRRTNQPSDKQSLIQQRMKKCLDFIGGYSAFACKHFGYRVGLRSCYNLAMNNLLLAFKVDYTSMTITPTYSEIAFSKGALLQPLPTGLSASTVGTFDIEWYNNAPAGSIRENDDLQVLFLQDNAITPILMENMAKRIDTTVSIPIPVYLQGQKIHVWIAFRAADTPEVANSIYVGEIQLV